MAGTEAPHNLLLVEGVDDEHVVKQLCERHNFTGQFEIHDSKGFPRLKDSISPQAKVSGRKALGILVDANENPVGRWQAVARQLQHAGFDPPPNAAREGTVIDGSHGRPRVGIWLMPDNVAAGQLEDFIRELIPEGDLVLPRASDYIEDIPEGERKFKPQKIQGAIVHAWLAAREEPRKMGTAIRARDLDANAVPAEEFVAWLRRLFG